jgi:flavin-dependent dehydrogenase
VIDATGSSRCLLREASVPPPSLIDPLLEGIGVEWLLQADDRVSPRWLDRISFFLGTRWIPHGYGWIFPMGNNRLKVGVCCLAPGQIRGSKNDLLARLQALLRNCKLEGCSVLDRHGGVVSSSIARRESLGSGALLAVGDAASTANLLGGEGIRHAIDSADLLAETLLNAEARNQVGPDQADAVRQTYEQALHCWFGWRWRVAGKLAQRTWWGLDSASADRRVERIIHGLSRTSSARDLSSLLFHYRFERYGLRLLRYLI